jgi:hypothetical protein
MTFYELMMCVLLEIKIGSHKGPNAFHATQQEISNKNSSFFDICTEIEKLGDNEFERTDKANESIALFLDEMKNSCNNDYTEQNILENLPHIIDLDGYLLRKTAHVMMSYIQDVMMNL